MRYILTVVILVGAFGTALYLRGGREAPANSETTEAVVLEVRPEVQARRVDGGTAVQLSLCFAGSCSRAKLVYRQDGEERVLDATTECRRSLKKDGSHGVDGYVSEINLGGTVPDGATDLRIILESETGTRIAPVEL